MVRRRAFVAAGPWIAEPACVRRDQPLGADMTLTGKELASLSELLDERHRALLAQVREEIEQSDSREYGKLIGALPGDVGDQSVADALADLNISIADRHIEELRAIEASLLRIRDGTYGTCIECGGEIGFERLSAYPTAVRCIQDQERVERTYAHESTPTL
jgi:DnaK suppressor protein